MENNEIMVNEEVMEATEEIAKAGVSKGFKVTVGIGLAAIGSVIAYKYVVKPLVAKIKAKKAQSVIEVESIDNEDENSDEFCEIEND